MVYGVIFLLFAIDVQARMAKKPASTVKLWSFTCSSSASDVVTKKFDGMAILAMLNLRNSEAKVRQKTVTFLGGGA